MAAEVGEGSMRGVSVEVKLTVAVLAIMLTTGALGVAVGGAAFERNAEQAGIVTLRRAADFFASRQRSETEKLAATIDALMADRALREAFLARDRARLLALAQPVFRTLAERDRISHLYFHEPVPDAAVFLRVHRPDLFGDRVERVTLRKAIETQEIGAGLELGKTAFALRVVRPWIADGKVIGYVELAEEIDSFMQSVHGRTGDEYGLIVKKKYLDEVDWARVLGPRANTWNDRADVVVVDTTTFTEGIVDFPGDLESIPEGGLGLGEIERGDRAFIRGIFPVRDAAGRQVGALFVLHDFTVHHAAIRAGLLQSFLMELALVVVSGLLVVLAVHRLVFARLGRLRRRMEARAAEAGLPPGRVVSMTSADEVGRLEAFLERIVAPARPRGDAPPAGRTSGPAA